MILTKDNLLNYVKEKGYVTPTTVSEDFDTTTMIASAALSELAKDKLIGITHLKTGTSPYYYDLNQPELLQELAEKHFSNYDRETYLKLKEQQVLNQNSLSIQEGLAIERIKDFAIPLEIPYQNRSLKFWVWYLRDINETRAQIQEALNSHTRQQEQTQKRPEQAAAQQESGPPKEQQTTQTSPKDTATQNQQTRKNSSVEKPAQDRTQYAPAPKTTQESLNPDENENTGGGPEEFIEDYLRQHHLKVESKNKSKDHINYDASLKLNNITVLFDCIYYHKKPSDSDILRFYSSSNKPKLVFIKNAPKKFQKLADSLENLEVISVPEK